MKRGISTNRNVASQAACLKHAGIDFVFRYYSETTHQPEKRLTQAESQALSAAGLGVGVIYEDAPTSSAYFSGTRGHQDALNAYSAALSLHQPAGSTIYFAVDYDASKADIAGLVFDYFCGVDRGMRDAGGGSSDYAVGVYGSGASCDFIKTQCSFVRFSWLAESMGWLGSTTYAGWDVKQSMAITDLCGLTPDEYEDNQAQDDFGGFVLTYTPLQLT
jgi:hypothetical protein